MTTASLLFVCLGNICRSPLAEAAMRAEAEKAGLNLIIDSAGTSDWHLGKAPDPRSQAVALRHGIDISGYKGRQVTADDFRRFTHIYALDAENLKDLEKVRPKEATATLSLLMDAVEGRKGTGVADPYYGDESGFDVTWTDVSLAARAIMESLQRA